MDDRLKTIVDKVRDGGPRAITVDDVTWMALEIEDLRLGRAKMLADVAGIKELIKKNDARLQAHRASMVVL